LCRRYGGATFGVASRLSIAEAARTKESDDGESKHQRYCGNLSPRHTKPPRRPEQF
jgi:hypothetical protein